MLKPMFITCCARLIFLSEKEWLFYHLLPYFYFLLLFFESVASVLSTVCLPGEKSKQQTKHCIKSPNKNCINPTCVYKPIQQIKVIFAESKSMLKACLEGSDCLTLLSLFGSTQSLSLSIVCTYE